MAILKSYKSWSKSISLSLHRQAFVTMPTKNIILYTLLFFAVVTLYAAEFRFFNLYLERTRFITIALGGGLLLGIILAWFLHRRWGDDRLDRLRGSIGIAFAVLFFFPLLFSLTNRWLSFRAPTTLPVEWVEEEPRYSSRFGLQAGEQVKPSSYHWFFYWQDRLYRISSPRSRYADAGRGETVPLPIKQGLWGFDWVVIRSEGGIE